MSTDLRQLSEREQEILRLVAAGLSNQQIANHLGVSINTIKVHLRNVFGKIGAGSRTEATMYAIRAGIVTVEQPGDGFLPEPDAEPGRVDLVEPAIDERVNGRSPVESPAPTMADDELPVSHEDPAEAEPAMLAAATQRDVVEVVPSTGPRARNWARAAAGLVLLALVTAGGLLYIQTSSRSSPLPSANAAVDDASGSRWRALANASTPRAGFAITNIGGLVYVVGGENQTGVVNTVERYDPRFETWTKLSQKPTGVADVQAVVLGGKLYIPGGRLSADPSNISTVFERYDPQTETWEKLPALPAPRSAYALAALEGKLYLFGGWDGTEYRGEVFEYDPERAAWRERTAMPTPRAFANAAAVDNSVYVLGGENAPDGQLTSNEVYTPAEEDERPWERRAPMPQPRSRFGVAVVLAMIHVLGNTTSDTSPVMYNVRTDSWQEFAGPPQPIGSQPGVVMVETRIMSIGGKLGPEQYAATVQEYQALFNVWLPQQQRAE